MFKKISVFSADIKLISEHVQFVSFKDPTRLNLAMLDHGIVYTLSDTQRKKEKNNQTQSWHEPSELKATK